MTDLDKALIFAILMENRGGLKDKSPDYITEKWQTINAVSEPLGMLDSINLAKFHSFKERWGLNKAERS